MVQSFAMEVVDDYKIKGESVKGNTHLRDMGPQKLFAFAIINAKNIRYPYLLQAVES